MKWLTLLTILYSVQLHAQDICSMPRSNGSDFPYYKRYYKSGLSRPVNDSTVIPQTLWKNINYRINELTNGSLTGKLMFKRVYTRLEKAELFERNNPVINDSGRLVYVQYRIVFELAMANSMRITFGMDVDANGNLMYINELPLLFEKKVPPILNCSAALQKVRAVKKDILSFEIASVYYNPLTLNFEWEFFEREPDNQHYLHCITIDAVTGNLLAVKKIDTKPPPVLMEINTGNDH